MAKYRWQSTRVRAKGLDPVCSPICSVLLSYMAKLWGWKNEFSDDTYTQRSPNLKECIERKIKYHHNETWEIIYYSSTSPPVLSIYNSAPRLVVKAPGTGRWYVWMRTKVVRFTACTVTWAHGLWTARAVFCSPASMSGSQENGQRYGLGGSGTAFRQQWPRGDRLMRARMWETHTHLLVLSLRTGSPQTSPSAFLGWSPIYANWGKCMRWCPSSPQL